MRILTIGFTKTTAEQFFGTLRQAGVVRVVDVRLHNTSQLAGFAKRDDLAFFLREIAGIEYLHLPMLAPTEEMLRAYRRGGGGWSDYERRFLDLIAERRIAERLDPAIMDGACLLCSESAPHACHRRLVAEHLREAWSDVEIQHLQRRRDGPGEPPPGAPAGGSDGGPGA
jgi:uncharacterized protein (DUF488 family)